MTASGVAVGGNGPRDQSDDDRSGSGHGVEQLRGEAQRLLVDLGAEDAEAAALLGNELIPHDPPLAARLLQHAARVAESAREWSHAAIAREREVRAWVAAGRAAEARAAVARARETADRVVDRDTRLRVLSNLAPTMREVGFADLAVDILALVVADRRDDVANGQPNAVESLAVALLNLGVVHIDQGRVRDGLDSLREAEVLAADLNDPRRLATIKANMAFAHSSMGDLRLARAAYREAADLYRRGGADAGDIGHAIRGEAATLAQAGRFSDAGRRYAEAIRVFAAAGLTHEVLRASIGHLVTRAALQERITEAELDELERRLDVLAPNELGQLARNLGNILLEQYDHERAVRLYHRARDAFLQLGRRVDVASVDMNLAIAARRAGDLDRARQLLLQARPEMEAHRRWRQVGHIDHNLARVLVELAGRDGTDSATLIREASARSAGAVAALDRFRHDLPTAHDRVALEQSVYPGVFPTAIRCGLAARQPATVAALIERARIQPVLPDAVDDMAFLEPRPVAARPGDIAIGGDGRTVYLAEEAVRLAGAGALWLGWWSDGTDLIAAAVDTDDVRVDVRPLRDILAHLAAALPLPTPAERQLCQGDETMMSHLALWRTARGPLLRDATLEDQLALAIPGRIRQAAVADTVVGDVMAMDADALLWSLSRLLLGDALLDDLASGGPPRPLVLAPPPMLGRIPWAALPVSDPGAGPAQRLVEVADIVVALPVSLSAGLQEHDEDKGETLLIADPLGDLRHARRLVIAGARRLGTGHAPATRDAFIAAARDAGTLVLVGHVRPGDPADPAASAIMLLAGGDQTGDAVPLTVADLAALRVPGTCVVLGCDGAGVATGNEWTGVATGLVWAGATRVVTTTWPVIDDRISTASDEDLIDHIRRGDTYHGLWSWQRKRAASLRAESGSRHDSIYRWAGTVAIATPRAAGHR